LIVSALKKRRCATQKNKKKIGHDAGGSATGGASSGIYKVARRGQVALVLAADSQNRGGRRQSSNPKAWNTVEKPLKNACWASQ
jgi:hypothetical protein